MMLCKEQSNVDAKCICDYLAFKAAKILKYDIKKLKWHLGFQHQGYGYNKALVHKCMGLNGHMLKCAFLADGKDMSLKQMPHVSVCYEDFAVYVDDDVKQESYAQVFVEKMVQLSQLSGFPGYSIARAFANASESMHIVFWHNSESFEELLVRLDLES